MGIKTICVCVSLLTLIGGFNQYVGIYTASTYFCKCKHHNVLIINPLLVRSRAVSMDFLTSKLVDQEVEAVILLIDDVLKVVIITYSFTQVYNAKKKGRYVFANF